MSNVLFFKIKGFADFNLLQLEKNITSMDNDSVQGFIVNECTDRYLKVTFWWKKIKNTTRFDIFCQEYILEKKEYIETAEARIDSEREIMIIIGNKMLTQKLITMITIASNNYYIIESIDVNMKKICLELIKLTSLQLVKVYMKDVLLEKNILVNCNVNLNKIDNPTEIINKYLDNIISLQILSIQTGVLIGLKENGKVSIGKCDVDVLDELIETLILIVRSGGTE